MAGPVAGVGLFGLFPSGRPERAYERVVIWTVALAGFLLPLLEAVSEANIAPAGGPPDSVPPGLVPRLVGARPGAAGRSRRGGVPHLSGLAGDRGGAARAALPAHRRGPAQADTLAVPRHGGLGQPVDPGWPCSGSWPTRTTRPPRPRATCCPTWRLAATAGVAARGVVLHRGIRYRRARPARVRAPCPAGIDRRRARRPGRPGRPADQPGRAGRRRRGGRRGRRGCGPGRSAPSGARRGPVGARRAAGGLRQPQPLRREPDPGARLGRAAARPGRGGPPRPGPDLGPGIAGGGGRAAAGGHGRHAGW